MTNVHITIDVLKNRKNQSRFNTVKNKARSAEKVYLRFCKWSLITVLIPLSFHKRSKIKDGPIL